MKNIKRILLVSLAGMALLTGCKGSSAKTTEKTTEETTEETTEKATEKKVSVMAKNDGRVGLGTVTTVGTQATTEAVSSGSSTQAATTSGSATDTTAYTQNTAETTTADTSSQSTTDSTQTAATDATTAQSATDADGELICPYCGLVYSGTDMSAYYSHIAACAEAEGARSSLATCPYCGEEFSTVIDDPASPGESMYDSHLAREEWANREYVMCQRCGEYYKNGTTHVCGQQ